MHDTQEIEKEILEFWKKKKIYEKTKKQNSKGKKFYFMDGPPYATGHIHIGTALNKILKDVAMRYKRLNGYDVFDRPGYDTHGLPIENKVEKKLGFNKKEEIEKYGVKKFIRECRKFATEFIDVMNEEFSNLGVWMDFKNPYLTLDNEYIESIWETFKKADEKSLLYLGKYPIHACTHCGTAVAYNEIEYQDQKDMSVYVKFKIKGSKNKHLIIWTTTPWTLPSNTGVMVNPKFDYAEVKIGKEIWILAKDRLSELRRMDIKFNLKKMFKGRELNGVEYENPLSKNLKLPKLKNAYRVILNERYVNFDEGTGLVHTAPGCGKEDFEAAQKENLPVVSIVNIDGTFGKEGGKYAGKKARIVDSEIIDDLEKGNALVYKELYKHEYPICWRCKSPLIMISVPQWFFKISSIHKNLLNSNKQVAWVPGYMQLRMNAWLEGISDWPISRNRYWGTPLPIWKCDKCDKTKVIGSISELEKLSKSKIKEIHKPEIDKVYWKCDCKGNMKRIPEVLDVWFDSGVSSWAALGYPKEKKLFNKFWPADLNIEGKDQFRGWWNSQLILSEIRFGKKPYNNILVHGMVLDIDKIKMSKSLENITSPQDIIAKYGRDYMRYYFAKISKGEDFSFDEGKFKEIGKVFRILLNINVFISQLEHKKSKSKIEDKWIISKLNSTINEITDDYNKFRVYDVVQKIEKFLVEDLSRNYIKIIRERSYEVKTILEKILIDILKVVSPVIPFTTEKIWQDLRNKKVVEEESIHLSSWPKADKKKIDKKLEKKFDIVFNIIEKGLAERDKAKIGLRWPLINVTVSGSSSLEKQLKEIIKKQLNAKKVSFKKIASKDVEVELNTKITPELEAEGYARELSRHVQAFRKKLGLEKKDSVELFISTDNELVKILEKQKEFIKERTNSKRLEISENVTIGKEKFKNRTDFKIKNKRGSIRLITTKK